jgi:class III poly(R)-hydroxyalkanoic acid synthase PhaE subunit
MSNSGFWNQDWMETQQKYWQTWTDMSQKAMGGAQPMKTPWENAMNHWWQAVSPGVPQAGQDFMTKMMDQGKAFLGMTDQFSRNLGSKTDMGAWSEAMEKALGDMQNMFSGGLKEGDDTAHKMMAFWEMPFDNWQRMVSSLSLTPGDALRNMPHDQVKENLNRFLTAPGLGYSREEQGQYQELIRAAIDYQKALQEYMQFFSNLGLKSVDSLRCKLEGIASEGKTVDSARGLYDMWVGCCEEVYAEQVMTQEYAKTHGTLVNALMRYKQRMSIMVDEALGTFNMPTRAELRTLQDRLQENRRENKALRWELDDLKEQVAALNGTQPAPATTASSAAPVKKTSVRRKTVAKKTAANPADQT